MCYFLLFLLTALHLEVTQGLLCFCDDSSCIGGVCEITNGSCVTHYAAQYDIKLSGCVEYIPKAGFRDADLCKFKPLQQRGIVSLCCDDVDMCNVKFVATTMATYPASTSTSVEVQRDTLGMAPAVIVGVTIAIVVLAISFAAAVVIVRFRSQRQTSPAPSATMETVDMSMTSGSGHGQPILVERTVARELTFKKEVGKGRYGTVWCGEWRGNLVAVKTFDPRESDSWNREVEIYQTHMLHHSSILRFIASDSRDKGAFTQFLLITEFHPQGSLFDYLNTNVLDVNCMLKFAESITDGLNYLHSEIKANTVKPCIAHRDLKSKNILVKLDRTCCIADLGLAVRHDSATGGVDIAATNRVGTKRYMAPEVLDESINSSSIYSYKMADIYSLSLVFWELFRRCQISGKVDEYELPYYDQVSDDPSLEVMMNVVCLQYCRPRIPARIEQHEKLSQIAAWVQFSWHFKPEVRLTALRMLKNIRKLKNVLPTVVETECI